MIINQNVSGGGSSPAPADPMSLKLKVSSGILQHDNTSAVSTTIDFTGVTTIDEYVLANAYYGNQTITGSAFRNGQVSNIMPYGAYQAFQNCTGLTSAGLDYLTTVNDNALTYTFYHCIGITSVNLSNVTTIGVNGMYATFQNCTNLTGDIEINIEDLNGGSLCYAFANTAITSLSFPSLINVNWDEMFNEYPLSGVVDGCTNVVIHFPSNLESNELISGYEYIFGGTNTTVLYDLDPTAEPEPEPEPEPEEPIEEP